MMRGSDQPILIVEMPEAVGFRGQIKSFLAWLQAWPKGGQLAAVLGSGVLAGSMPAWPPRSQDNGSDQPKQD